MTAEIMDGKKLAKEITEEIKTSVATLSNKPCLAVILVGENPASHIYVKNKKKKVESLGMKSQSYILPERTTEVEILSLIDELNADTEVNGILVQSPLPEHLNENHIAQRIKPIKDVDCFTYENIAKLFLGEYDGLLPCTPQGIIHLLKTYVQDIKGMNACVIGRSKIVGKPVSFMLSNEDCSVDLCHSKTEDLKSHCLKADIIVSCVGRRGLITADMVKEDAIIIDIGITRDFETKKIYGDVDFDNVKEKASFITPVPGGVGPMTIAYLMKNLFEAYKKQNNI